MAVLVGKTGVGKLCMGSLLSLLSLGRHVAPCSEDARIVLFGKTSVLGSFLSGLSWPQRDATCSEDHWVCDTPGLFLSPQIHDASLYGVVRNIVGNNRIVYCRHSTERYFTANASWLWKVWSSTSNVRHVFKIPVHPTVISKPLRMAPTDSQLWESVDTWKP
jgi:hypothetical protein